ncbi:putative DNA helicase ino80, partial [Clydaea vesicula]
MTISKDDIHKKKNTNNEEPKIEQINKEYEIMENANKIKNLEEVEELSEELEFDKTDQQLLASLIESHQRKKRLNQINFPRIKKGRKKFYQKFLVQYHKKCKVSERSEENLLIKNEKSSEIEEEENSEIEENVARDFIEVKYKKIWKKISTNFLPKAHKILTHSNQVKKANHKKIAQLCAREVEKTILKERQIQKKDLVARTKKATREMLQFWKKNEKEEREERKKYEKEELERRKVEEELREAKRQARKLNFLISQTEIYGHFIGKNLKDISSNLNLENNEKNADDDMFDELTEEQLEKKAQLNAKIALEKQQEKTKLFDQDVKSKRLEIEGDLMNICDEELIDKIDFKHNEDEQNNKMDVKQPEILTCQLKNYQLKGLKWLANLYEQGINGILADEMGLGKTVQSIALMAYLAEAHNIWGPFLIISPASTLHNWQQEVEKFAPSLKTLPYWGNVNDRKVLRSFWNSNKLYTKDAPFHALITSYQLVVTDEQYFRRINWQYMILDEAQAIKSSNSARWKTLLNFNCRNRLLLTGTPVQNSMQELWSLLHFIMPTLFEIVSVDSDISDCTMDIKKNEHLEMLSGTLRTTLQLLKTTKIYLIQKKKLIIEKELLLLRLSEIQPY